MFDWLFPKRVEARRLHEQKLVYYLKYTREIHWTSSEEGSDDITGYVNIWFYENGYGDRKVQHEAVGPSRKSPVEHHKWWRYVNLWLRKSIDVPPETGKHYTAPKPPKKKKSGNVIEVDFKKDS